MYTTVKYLFRKIANRDKNSQWIILLVHGVNDMKGNARKLPDSSCPYERSGQH